MMEAEGLSPLSHSAFPLGTYKQTLIKSRYERLGERNARGSVFTC